MKDNEALVGESNFVQPPPYMAYNKLPGMVAIQTEQSYIPGQGQQQQPTVSNVNVQLIVPPLQRWPFYVGLVWLLLMLAAGISIYVFGFLDFKNRNFPSDTKVAGSGYHFGVNASRYFPHDELR